MKALSRLSPLCRVCILTWVVVGGVTAVLVLANSGKPVLSAGVILLVLSGPYSLLFVDVPSPTYLYFILYCLCVTVAFLSNSLVDLTLTRILTVFGALFWLATGWLVTVAALPVGQWR